MLLWRRPKIKKICVVCGREFEGEPQRQTCSNACRQRLYRQRKQSARTVELIRGKP